jgi:hypothetical protein
LLNESLVRGSNSQRTEHAKDFRNLQAAFLTSSPHFFQKLAIPSSSESLSNFRTTKAEKTDA